MYLKMEKGDFFTIVGGAALVFAILFRKYESVFWILEIFSLLTIVASIIIRLVCSKKPE